MSAKPLSRRLYAILAIVFGAVLFVALNIAADTSLTAERIDLTQNGLYTISPGTREILRGLKEPVRLKFYYSKKTAAGYAQVSAYAARVRDLLRHYAAIADGKLIVEEIDPQPYTRAEDEANAAGLAPAQADNGELVYFGLAASNTVDGQETIPFFSLKREPFLEYDLSSLIDRLSRPKKPVIGVFSSLPLETGAGGMMAALQGRAQPYAIWQQLQQNYQTTMLEADFKAIPKDVDVLMIVQPNALTPVQRYAIDQFVLGGGHALIFVDPQSDLAAASSSPNGPPVPAASDLPELFRRWGIGYSPKRIVADGRLAQQVQTSEDPRNGVALFPTWLRLGKDQLDAHDQVTASLTNLNLATAGALSPLKGAHTQFTPLITSSGEASLLDAATVRLSPRQQDLMDQIHPDGTHYTLAARITGPAETAFPQGPPPGAPAGPQRKAARQINLIAVADTDLFDDRFWVRTDTAQGKSAATPFADNGAFILNAIENLSGSDALISLRTRAVTSRPFTVVQDLQAKAQARFQEDVGRLQTKLADTQSRLRALEQGDGGDGKSASLTPGQQDEIDNFKRELIDTRLQLREVQSNLRKDVDRLGAWLAVFNIAFIPVCVALFALGLGVYRRRRRARAMRL